MTNLTDMLSKFERVPIPPASTSGSGTLPSNTITNPKVDLKGITIRSGVAYQGPTIPTTPKAVGNPTPYYDLIISTSSPTLTPFGDSDFLLEEVDAFLALEDDPTSPEVDDSYYDPEGDILLLEAFLNDDPSLPPPTQEIICQKFEKNLKFMKLKLINLQLMNLPRSNSRTYLLISNMHFWKATTSCPS
ncbi:hypothetical protein Tco_0929264 [Tanacetum coccineum]